MRQCTYLTFAMVVMVLAVVAAVAVVATPVHGRAAAASDNRNAATWYIRAYGHLENITEADWEAMWAYAGDPSGSPSPRMREAMAKAAPMIDLVRRGAQQEYADYHLDYDQGFELLLPHLAQMRSIAKIMRYDVMVRLHDGDAAGAADRIAALYSVADHGGDDGTIISSLVGQAIFNLAEETAQHGYDRAAFDSDDASIMLRALRRLDTTDPFGAFGGVAGEQALTLDWLARKYGEQEDRQQMLDDFQWMGSDNELVHEMMGMTDEEFADEIAEYDLLMNRVVEAFSMSDREAGRAAMEQLDEEMETRQHGALATLLMPALDKVFTNMVRGEEQLAKRLAVLEGLVTGAITPQEEANAALFYARAIELAGKIERSDLDAVLAYQREPTGAPTEQVAATLAAAEGVLDLARTGSEKHRCDFSMLRSPSGFELCADYIAGMWDILRILLADAHRLLRAGETGGFADRLEVILPVIAHVGGDDRLLSVRVAHAAFGRAIEAVLAGLDAGGLTDTHRRDLLSAMRRIGRKDPFGYVRSVTVARERCGSLVYVAVAPDGGDQELYESIHAALSDWDGDRLLHYLVVRDTLEQAGKDEATSAIEKVTRRDSRAVDRLDGVVDASRLDAIRRSVPTIAPALARGEIDVLGGDSVPSFAGFVEGMRTARADLREGLALLHPVSAAATRPAATPSTNPAETTAPGTKPTEAAAPGKSPG